MSPKTTKQYIDHAESKRLSGDYRGSIEEATKAINSDQKAGSAYSVRAESRRMLGDYGGCINDATEAINLNPWYAPTYYTRADSKRMLGDYRGCIEDATEAIKLNPTSPLAYWTRAESKRMLGDYNGSIEDATRAINLNAKYAAAYRVRALSKRSLRDYEGSIGDFTQAITLNPSDINLYFTRANTLLIVGDFKAAIEDANEILKLNKDKDDSYIIRAEAKTVIGTPDDALIEIEQAIAANSNGNRPYTYAMRAEIHRIAGRLDKALEDINYAIGLMTSNKDGYIFWISADIKRMMGDEEGAFQDACNAITSINIERAYVYVVQFLNSIEAFLVAKNISLEDLQQKLEFLLIAWLKSKNDSICMDLIPKILEKLAGYFPQENYKWTKNTKLKSFFDQNNPLFSSIISAQRLHVYQLIESKIKQLWEQPLSKVLDEFVQPNSMHYFTLYFSNEDEKIHNIMMTLEASLWKKLVEFQRNKVGYFNSLLPIDVMNHFNAAINRTKDSLGKAKEGQIPENALEKYWVGEECTAEIRKIVRIINAFRLPREKIGWMQQYQHYLDRNSGLSPFPYPQKEIPAIKNDFELAPLSNHLNSVPNF